MLGLSVIILFKSLLHVFCSLVFSAHNSSAHSDTINCTEQSAAAKYLPLPPPLRTNRRRVIRPTDCLSRKIHCATQKCPTGWYIKVIFFQGPLMPLLQLHSFLELRWTRCIQLHVNCQCKELPTFDWTSKSNSVEGRLMVLRISIVPHNWSPKQITVLAFHILL